MTLQTDKDGFQNGYYLVGTGMIRMPSHGIVYVADRSCRVVKSRHRPSPKDSGRRAAGSAGWLVRLNGHMRRLVAPFHRMPRGQ